MQCDGKTHKGHARPVRRTQRAHAGSRPSRFFVLWALSFYRPGNIVVYVRVNEHTPSYRTRFFTKIIAQDDVFIESMFELAF